MKKLFSFLKISFLVVFSLTGCEGLIPESYPLINTQWKLSSWAEDTIDPSLFYITANFDESTISGTSSINFYSGSYLVKENHYFLILEDLQMTLMGGSEEAMKAEATYFQLLQESCKYTVSQTKLELFDCFENELLTFIKVI